jgi:hypothetical protein
VWVKVAFTERAIDIGTVQVGSAPEQPSPVQPVKVELESGWAVSVTEVPWT